jgi:hypothetical protein
MHVCETRVIGLHDISGDLIRSEEVDKGGERMPEGDVAVGVVE